MPLAKLPPLREMQPVVTRITEHLACVATSPESTVRRECRECRSWNDLDWRLARVAGSVQGILPLLASAAIWDEAPADWPPFLQQQVELTQQRSQRMLAHLHRVLELAQEHGLRTMPLKGMDLFTSLYAGDGLALRPTSDIDLLIPEADRPRWRQVAAQAGFVPVYDTSRHAGFAMPPNRVVALVGDHPDNPIKLELHTRVAEDFVHSRCDITDVLWRDARTEARDGRAAIYPSSAARMLHLLMHTSVHMLRRSARLIQLRDVALAAQDMCETDRAALCVLLDEVDGWWWAYPPLAVAQRYFDGTVPEAWVERARAAAPPWMRQSVPHMTITRVSCCQLSANLVRHRLLWARGVTQAFKQCAAFAFPSRETLEEWDTLQPGSSTGLAARSAYARRVLRRLSPNAYRDSSRRMLAIVLGD